MVDSVNQLLNDMMTVYLINLNPTLPRIVAIDRVVTIDRIVTIDRVVAIDRVMAIDRIMTIDRVVTIDRGSCHSEDVLL